MSKIGKISEPDTLYLRQHIGTAQGQDDTEYEMSLVNMHIPTVRSKKTGRFFLLSWVEILDLAVDAGINEPTKEAAHV